MPTPDELESQVTLRTAVARYERLWVRQVQADNADELSSAAGAPSLTAAEALELLALQEVIARKAGYGRQLAVRAARAAGASWSQIGKALGTSKQTAWEAHARWIEGQAKLQADTGVAGLAQAEATQARALAGAPDQEDER